MHRRGARIGLMLALACFLVVLLHMASGGAIFTWLYALWPLGQGDASKNGVELRVWREDEAPNYYMVVGPAQFEEQPDVGEICYSGLDSLGRAGRVVACVDARLAEEGTSRERQSTANIFPSGWGHNEEVTIELPGGGSYHGYMWNRSHLLAKSLGGEEVAENLVCGTRMQNVGANRKGGEGGMAFPESLARDWLSKNPNGSVTYVATPCYAGNELVCRNVVVDIRSSDGTLDCEIVVFNAAKGFDINYEDGSFRQR